MKLFAHSGHNHLARFVKLAKPFFLLVVARACLYVLHVDDASPQFLKKSSSLRYWYGDNIAKFLGASGSSVLGDLAANCDFAVLPTQRDAWLWQIEFLRSQLSDLSGAVFFEFNIPRMGHRIDAVMVTGGIVLVVEFKVGEKKFDRASIDQVWDYGLDLKNFHEGSHNASIVPVLVATEATKSPALSLVADPDKLYRPIVVDPKNFRSVIEGALRSSEGITLNAETWSRAPYHPVPTIVEAARALYAQHSVEAIARFDAGAKNLNLTSRRIEELVDEAQSLSRKRICFVTGVPGAGKTLVGLNVATRRPAGELTHAVFLSGNGPLVRSSP